MASLGASLLDSRSVEQLARGPDHMALMRKQPQLKLRAELSANARLGVFCGAGATKQTATTTVSR